MKTLPIETSIESLSHEGRGITHINGKTVFITGALPEELISFQYIKNRPKFAEGKTVTVLKAAPTRVIPKCEHFGICGGCSLQHLNTDAQIDFKQKILLEHLQHIGGCKPKNLLPPLRGPIWGYRHKARLGVRYVKKKGKILVGFHENNSRYIAELNSCQILHPNIGTKILLIGELIAQLSIYEHIPQLEVAVSETTTALIFRHLQELNAADQQKLIEFAKKENFYIYLQPAGPDSIHLLWPEQTEDLLFYLLPAQNLKIWFHPADFTQINMAINQQMVTQALNLLQPKRNERILDLFCGLGNFTLPLAQLSDFVTGIEGDNKMVKRCQLNATRNKLSHINFYATNLAGNFAEATWAQPHYDKILIDPPRCGAAEIMQYMPNFSAKTILYISCNTATLARDAGELIKQGYDLTAAGVMDMFPHTSHVEAMALFKKD